MLCSSAEAVASSRWCRNSELTATSQGGQPAAMASCTEKVTSPESGVVRACAYSTARGLMSMPTTRVGPSLGSWANRPAIPVVTSPPPQPTSTTTSGRPVSWWNRGCTTRGTAAAICAAVRDTVLILARARNAWK